MPGLTGVAPSILSADFARLGAQVDEVVAAGARLIHCDVMDGHFVPPITLGPLVVAALRERLPAEVALDVHLMVERPERQVPEFLRAGATGITFHVEATPHVDFTMGLIRAGGASAGVALNPGTATGALAVAPDLALCMTVNPGWGGQPFIERSVDRVADLRERLGGTAIEVDGGIDATTAPRCAAAGATTFVAGSAVFGADDPAAAYRAIVDAVAAGRAGT